MVVAERGRGGDACVVAHRWLRALGDQRAGVHHSGVRHCAVKRPPGCAYGRILGRPFLDSGQTRRGRFSDRAPSEASPSMNAVQHGGPYFYQWVDTAGPATVNSALPAVPTRRANGCGGPVVRHPASGSGPSSRRATSCGASGGISAGRAVDTIRYGVSWTPRERGPGCGWRYRRWTRCSSG